MTNEPNDPAAPPGEDVKDVPEATLEVEDDVAPVPFEDSLDDPQDAVPQEPRRRSKLVKGLSAMGLSTVARRFDRRGQGELDEAEQRARDLADTQGHVRPDQAITAMELGMANEKKLTKAVRHVRLLSVLAFVFFVGLFVAVFFASDNAVAKGNVEVKQKIDESVQTDVAVDALGDPHLTDKATGKDVTVKADGVVAGTTPRVLNGRKLTCISMVDVAKAVGGLATAATKVNLVFHDEEGTETEITPLLDYKDEQSFLSFDGGRIKILLDSDACDSAATLDDGVEGVRRLGQVAISTSRPGAKGEGIQAKLRHAFVSARTALREGRRLDSNVEVEVTVDGTQTCFVELESGLRHLAQSPYLPFENRAQLKEAVDAYIDCGCATTPGCTVEGTYGPIGFWDVSRVTDMSFLFENKRSFDEDISDWDTSSVTTMQGMFQGARAFNRDLAKWDTSSVTDMSQMFYGAWAFNGDVSNFDTSKVTDMSQMFAAASSFNGDVSNFDTSRVTSMGRMFDRANAFNGDMSNWDTSQVTDMDAMFNGASSFNGDVSNWDTSKVTRMDSMFWQASLFNGDVSNFDTSSVTSTEGMFREATAFNQDLSSWDVSSVTDMYEMFRGASSFSGDICTWGAHHSTTVDYRDMFRGSNCDNTDDPAGKYGNWCASKCPAPYHLVGCYKDDTRNRDFPATIAMFTDDVTQDTCHEACRNLGYKYFGLQGNDWGESECFCGNNPGSHGEATGCDCSWGPTNFGSDKNCVYTIRSKLTLDPCDIGEVGLYFPDEDRDGYGNKTAVPKSCIRPWHVLNNQDCDDADRSVNPGAQEVCGDGIDNDCDGKFLDPSTEVCDGLDNDCDGNTDEGTMPCEFSCSGSIPMCTNLGSKGAHDNVCQSKNTGDSCDCDAECAGESICRPFFNLNTCS